MIIYGSLREALSGSAPGRSPATRQFSKLPFKPRPSARVGAQECASVGTTVSGVGSLGLETSCALSLGHHGLFCSFHVALPTLRKEAAVPTQVGSFRCSLWHTL